MYKLYRLNKKEEIISTPFLLLNNISKEKVTIKNTGFFRAIYWNIISHNKASIYFIKDEKGIVHSSYVIEKCCKFPFMKKDDIEIGPCYTRKDMRGKGIYPSVLNYIIQTELTEHNFAYMIVEENNSSSLRGIQKLGFINIGNLKKDIFKNYVIIK